ncbi:serine protease hepsin-like protein [Leptotrombidium deliense]|uniref:Serine protease hepsin-like protein n=1 Tax=Leptotrombidium deliense TaxID=299467 RepID=A0A443SHP0_9ACAR|nr:serine protease hepsin-like protein [Leptotrombidium deliense]
MKLVIIGFLYLFATSINDVQCSRRKRFINGNNSKPNAWPWMGLLVTGTQDWQICGCSVISDQWLLTAAHCVREEQGDPLKYHVILGEHNRNRDEGTEVRRNLTEI